MNGLCYGSNCISSQIYVFLRSELILFNLANSYVLGKIKMFPFKNTSISKVLRNISKAIYSSIFTSCCWVTESCPTLCDPIDCSIPGFPVLHYLLEFVQTPVHWVGDAIQPSHPLLPLLLLPSIFPSIRIFSNESLIHKSILLRMEDSAIETKSKFVFFEALTPSTSKCDHI